MALEDDIQLDRLARSLVRSFATVGDLVDAIQPGQWSAPTQCLDWTVHRLVEHLVGKNLVFAAVLAGQPLPQRGDGLPSEQLAGAYRESAAGLLDGFAQPGALDRTYQGPLGPASPRLSGDRIFCPSAGMRPIGRIPADASTCRALS